MPLAQPRMAELGHVLLPDLATGAAAFDQARGDSNGWTGPPADEHTVLSTAQIDQQKCGDAIK
jgi:hypothetical protein